MFWNYFFLNYKELCYYWKIEIKKEKKETEAKLKQELKIKIRYLQIAN